MIAVDPGHIKSPLPGAPGRKRPFKQPGTGRNCPPVGKLLYSIEDVLLRIASRVDKSLPTGEKWHKDLLFRMTLRIPAIRPPVLDRRLYEVLDEYRRFRQRSRHVYRPPIPDWAKMKHLAENIGDNFQETKRQVGLFIDFLNKLIASLEEEEAEGK